MTSKTFSHRLATNAMILTGIAISTGIAWFLNELMLGSGIGHMANSAERMVFSMINSIVTMDPMIAAFVFPLVSVGAVAGAAITIFRRQGR
jgi:hypothetical protein